ncbi:hypothetical protein BDR06DRAFT_1014303 [Suillus hirtellus]|nr:hypothetical protein BDR06DRAFT_1014303 [Suillus hirtellus]
MRGMIPYNTWNKVGTTTIQNCWQHASILPDLESTSSPTRPIILISSLVHFTDATNNPTAHAETLVKNALDDLEATGALQSSNQMDIAGLLNPAIETTNIFNATDEEIFGSVMDAKRLWEKAAGGNDDSDDDSDIDVPAPGPTCCEALQATLTLRKYLGTFDEPLACKLKVMLGSSGQQTLAVKMQGMKDMTLTDYFSHK